MANPTPKTKAIQIDQFLGLNTLDDPKSLNPAYSPLMVNMDITSTGSVQSRFGYEEFATIPAVTGGLSGLLPYYRTYDDNSAIDQSADQSHSYANTYTVPVTPISETATNKLTFTPTKSKVLSIAVYVVAKGTGSWDMTLHDASNNVLGTATILNADLVNGAFNYFYMYYTVTSGPLHFHITSTVADGTVKTNVAGDLSTASFIETYSTIGDYLLLFHKGTAYQVTNDNTTPASIGTFGPVGEDNGQVNGVVSNNVAIFNDGHAGNQGRYWNAFALSTLSSSSIYPQYFGTYNNRTIVSGSTAPSTIYFGDASTVDTGLTTNFLPIGLGDGTIVTGFSSSNNQLQILKENSVHAANFGFDASYNMTTLKEQPIISGQGGAYAPGSTQAVYNFLYFLSELGFQNYGNQSAGVAQSMPLPLSFIIDNTVKNINYLFKNEITSALFTGRYLCAAPLGSSQTNDYTFVYNQVVKSRYGSDNWVLYKGIPIRQFALFRDVNLRNQLYFASNTEPVVYKFNTTFSDNGFGFERLWRSKTFQFGERTRFIYLDIEGSKPVGTKIYVDIVTDGIEVNNIIIDDNNFTTSTTGSGYIGDNYIGDSFIGGGFYGADAIPMYQFRARIRFPLNVCEGYAMYYQVRNNGNNEGWKMTRNKLTYEMNPDDPTYASTDTN